MPRVLQSTEFRRDTDAAWDYLAAQNLDGADRFIRQVAEKLALLAEFPRMGRLREELQPDLRSVVVGRHVIYYRVVEDRIEAPRLLHGAQDVEGLF